MAHNDVEALLIVILFAGFMVAGAVWWAATVIGAALYAHARSVTSIDTTLLLGVKVGLRALGLPPDPEPDDGEGDDAEPTPTESETVIKADRLEMN